MNENIRSLWTTLSPQQRALAMCAALLAGLSAYSFWLASEAAVVIEPKRTAERKAPAVQASAPYMPQGYRADTIVRDPFSPPQVGRTNADRDKPAIAATARLPQNKSTSPSSRLLQKPILTGIIVGEASRVAIMEYNGQSGMYRLNDTLGPYQLLALSENSVVLNSPDGQLTLALGR